MTDAQLTSLRCFLKEILLASISDTIGIIKGARSYFSKLSFLFHLKNHNSKDVNLKFPSYCESLVMVIITRHIFIDIFQNECFSAVNFSCGV